ncbi:erythroferrone isoform 3-T3 [Morphnus guianensis]
MQLPELCLALLCAAGSAGAARERSPGPGTAAGRAAEAGRGGPGAAVLRAGDVDPRQAWLLLAGSSGRGSRSRDRGRTGTMRDGTGAGAAPVPGGQSPGQPAQAALQVGVPGAAPAPPGAPAVLEELLRELHLLLKGMVKEQAKTRRKAWEGREEEEESGEGNPQAGSHRRVEAAFHCRTRENISVEQRGQQELQLYYIVSAQPAALSCLLHLPAHGGTRPGAGADSLTRAFPHPQPEREGMFHRGSGLNLTSGQYTAPIAGYYTFTATLHIGEPSGTPHGPAGEVQDGSHPPLCPSAQRAAEEGAAAQGESSAAADLRAVPLPAQQVGQGKARRGEGPWAREGGRSPAAPGEGGTHSSQHHPPSSAAIWRPCPGWRAAVTFSPSPLPESFTCRLGSMPLFSWTTLQALPSPFKVALISVPFCWVCEKALGTTQGTELVPGAAGPFPLPATIMPHQLSTKPREDLSLLQELQAGPILLMLQNYLQLDKRSGRKGGG